MLCRAVPALVARHPEILDFPKPKGVPKDIPRYHKKLKRRVVELVMDKLL